MHERSQEEGLMTVRTRWALWQVLDFLDYLMAWIAGIAFLLWVGWHLVPFDPFFDWSFLQRWADYAYWTAGGLAFCALRIDVPFALVNNKETEGPPPE